MALRYFQFMQNNRAAQAPLRTDRFKHDIVVPEIFFSRSPLGGMESEFIRARKDLTHQEKNILIACYMTKKLYDREMHQTAQVKTMVTTHVAREVEEEKKELLHGFSLRAIFYRLMNGQMAATHLDFDAKEVVSGVRQDIELAQRARRKEVTDFACHQEEKYRAKLAAIGSPTAKRLFNEVGITGRTITHFKPHEMASPAPARRPAITP